MMRTFTYTICLSVLSFAAALPAQGEEKLVYVRKATRDETLRASLAASGQPGWPDEWHIIGPFDNGGLATVCPPEQKIDVAAKYPAKGGGEAGWKKVQYPDGQVHDLKANFTLADNCICYLYRQITVESDSRIRVSLGS